MAVTRAPASETPAHARRAPAITVFALALLPVLPGCAVLEQLFSPELSGSDWQLVAWEGHPLPRDKGDPVRLHFGPERILGYTGCNAFRLNYQLLASHLSTKRWKGTTERCDTPTRTALERAFKRALLKGGHLRQDGDTLSLTVDDGAPLLFQRIEP